MSVEFHRETKHKARKAHICDLCHKTIMLGEEYIEEASKCVGYDVFYAKECISCNDIIRRYCHEYAGEEFSLESISEDIAETVCYGCENNEDCDYNWNQVAQCEKVKVEYLQ